MRKLVALAIASTMTACGDDEGPSPGEQLQGKWGTEIAGTSCVQAFAFEGETFELDMICTLNDGSVGVQASVGTFAYDGESLTWSLEQSTCPAIRDRVATISAELAGGRLSTTDGARVVVLERIDESQPGGVTALFGCFDADLAFTPRGLSALK